MADVKWDAPLKEWQASNPVVHMELLQLGDDVPIPTDEELLQVFKTGGYKLQTWNRAQDENGKVITKNNPHWIAVRGGTPLHVDPRYPRYSHHLKVRVDEGIFVRGKDKVEAKLERGIYYVLDTHSPHQISHKGKKVGWNVAASIDADEVIDRDEAVNTLLNYVKNTNILTGAE